MFHTSLNTSRHTHIIRTVTQGRDDRNLGPVDMRVEATGPLCASHHPRPPPLHLVHHRHRKTFASSLKQTRTLPVCVGEPHSIALIYVDFTALTYYQNAMLLLGNFNAPNLAELMRMQLLDATQ